MLWCANLTLSPIWQPPSKTTLALETLIRQCKNSKKSWLSWTKTKDLSTPKRWPKCWAKITFTVLTKKKSAHILAPVGHLWPKAEICLRVGSETKELGRLSHKMNLMKALAGVEEIPKIVLNMNRGYPFLQSPLHPNRPHLSNTLNAKVQE